MHVWAFLLPSHPQQPSTPMLYTQGGHTGCSISSLKANPDLYHELNFCLALRRMYCDIYTEALHSVFMMGKKKSLLSQVFQVLKPHQHCSLSGCLTFTFSFLFHNHYLLPAPLPPGLTTLRSPPCPQLLFITHLLKVLKTGTCLDPFIPLLKMPQSLAFLCYSLFHLFTPVLVLLDTG